MLEPYHFDDLPRDLLPHTLCLFPQFMDGQTALESKIGARSRPAHPVTRPVILKIDSAPELIGMGATIFAMREKAAARGLSLFPGL